MSCVLEGFPFWLVRTWTALGPVLPLEIILFTPFWWFFSPSQHAKISSQQKTLKNQYSDNKCPFSLHPLFFGTMFQTMNSVFSGWKGWPQALFRFLSSSCSLETLSRQWAGALVIHLTYSHLSGSVSGTDVWLMFSSILHILFNFLDV